MIKQLLSPETCAECCGCCVFDESDLWEAPAPTTESDGLFICDHLTKHGCELGDNKPLECAMYPFRVMRLGEHKVIAVCKFCQPVMDLPLTRLLRFVEEKQEEFLKVNIVKDYNPEYVILKVVECTKEP
jgi:hypothetical protein